MSVLLWTDTLGDVNGVARFLWTAAHWSARWCSTRGLARTTSQQGAPPLRIFTSTRKATADLHTITNFEPRYARRMPFYPQLDLSFPPVANMIRAADVISPRVIHVSTPGPVGLVGRWYARARGLPLVGVYHTDFPAYVGGFTGGDEILSAGAQEYMRWFYRPFTRVLLRSAGAAAPLQCERSRYTLATLRPGVDVTLFSPGARTRTNGPPRVLYVGRLSVEKNLMALARVWRAVASECPEARLWMVGDGPQRKLLERELSGCNVTFTGFLHGQDLARAYADADLFVFPSNTETLGQTVLEACASGLAVVVTDQGGPASLITHTREGAVVPLAAEGDESVWVRTIVALLRDEQQRAAMAASAHALAQKHGFEASFVDFLAQHA